MTHPKRTVNKRVFVAQAVAIAIMLVIAWFVWKRDDPERLPDFGQVNASGYALLANGVLYRLSQSGTGPTILHREVLAKEHVLVEEKARYQFTGGRARISAADGFVYYGLEDYRKSPQSTGGSGGGASAIRYLGEFAQVPNTGGSTSKSTAKRVKVPSSQFKPVPILFRQVSARGGPAKDVATVRDWNPVLVGSHVFWTKQGLFTRVDVSRGNDRWSEVSGTTDIMLTDLAIGAEHRIGTTRRSYVDWVVGKDGVMWTDIRPYPDRTKDLFYARVSDGTVVKLGELGESETTGWSVESQGSVYWFMQDAESTVLKAANVDGSDLRQIVHLNRAQLQAQPEQNLGANGGVLYCLLNDANIAPAGAARVRLARIHPERINPVEIVCTLPQGVSALPSDGASIGQIGFDGGYLYFYITEPQRGLWQTITDDNAGSRFTKAIWRVRLP